MNEANARCSRCCRPGGGAGGGHGDPARPGRGSERESGAERALAALGLKDEQARRDMDELRELLQAWRDAKKSAWKAVVTWAVRILLALLVPG